MGVRRAKRVAMGLGLAALVAVSGAWFWLASDDPVYRAKELAAFGRYGRFDVAIAEAAARHGLDPFLVKAVVWRESRFHAEKQGAHRERGLMQVGEAAAQDWREAVRVPILQGADLLDPHTNLEVGCWYLGRAMRRWAGSDSPEVFALAEYNAGLRRVREWVARDGEQGAVWLAGGGSIHPPTREYLVSILERREFLRGSEDAVGAFRTSDRAGAGVSGESPRAPGAEPDSR